METKQIGCLYSDLYPDVRINVTLKSKSFVLNEF
jgi:hypothetical protein